MRAWGYCNTKHHCELLVKLPLLNFHNDMCLGDIFLMSMFSILNIYCTNWYCTLCMCLKQAVHIHWFSVWILQPEDIHRISSDKKLFVFLKPQAQLCHGEQGLREPYITPDAMQHIVASYLIGTSSVTWGNADDLLVLHMTVRVLLQEAPLQSLTTHL